LLKDDEWLRQFTITHIRKTKQSFTWYQGSCRGSVPAWSSAKSMSRFTCRW
jgi:hypothetical protein